MSDCYGTEQETVGSLNQNFASGRSLPSESLWNCPRMMGMRDDGLRSDMTTMNNASEFASLSLNERVHVALDLAEKISMDHHSFSETVSAIVKQLTPEGDGVSPDGEALKLAEALLERLRDMRPHCELMDCLDSMRAGTAH